MAPSVSGSLLGYTCYLVVAVLRDSSLWLSVVYGLRLVDLNKETTLRFLLFERLLIYVDNVHITHEAADDIHFVTRQIIKRKRYYELLSRKIHVCSSNMMRL